MVSPISFLVRLCPSLQTAKEEGVFLLSGYADPLGEKCFDRHFAFIQHVSASKSAPKCVWALEKASL